MRCVDSQEPIKLEVLLSPIWGEYVSVCVCWRGGEEKGGENGGKHS